MLSTDSYEFAHVSTERNEREKRRTLVAAYPNPSYQGPSQLIVTPDPDPHS